VTNQFVRLIRSTTQNCTETNLQAIGRRRGSPPSKI